MSVQGEVQFVRVAFCSVNFPDDLESQYLGVEFFGPIVIGADDRDMVKGMEYRHFLIENLKDWKISPQSTDDSQQRFGCRLWSVDR